MATITSEHAATWPRQSKKLLNHAVDDLARERPGALYAELPVSPVTFDEGFRRVTYRDFSNAINGMAWWLTRSLGIGKDFETLVYIGPNDMRHNILLLGAVKAGYKMLFMSPSYSGIAHVNLMKQLNCKTMLVPTIRPVVVNTILEVYETRVYQIPELKDLLDQEYTYYPYEKTFDEARSEPLVALHTSGTTGLPKPVIWTHDWAASFAEERYLTPPSGFDLMDGLVQGARLFSLMPPFHASHLFASIFFAIFSGSTVIYPVSGLPPSAKMAADCLRLNKVDAITLIPPFVEEIARNQKLLDFLSHEVGTVFWGGGDISKNAGEAFSSKFKLFTAAASTEMGFSPTLRHRDQWQSGQWKYMRFHPAMNLKFHHHVDDLFEGRIQRNPNSEYQQPIFRIFQNLQEYRTGDLFSSHPLDSELWQYRGRTDDMQIFLSGSNYHPATLERRIAQHPDVQDALFVGTGRPHAALLLEMRVPHSFELSSDRVQLLEKLWPTIEEANQICPAFAKITKQHVLFVTAEKPMVRSEKKTIQRRATVQLYEEELNELLEPQKT